jgi:hypothetical protein
VLKRLISVLEVRDPDMGRDTGYSEFPRSFPQFLKSNARILPEITQRQLPTSAVRVRAQVRSCGIYDGQSGTGAGFLPVFRFPLPILIPSTAPHLSSSIIRGWYNRPVSG